jgi:hypothetical protein
MRKTRHMNAAHGTAHAVLACTLCVAALTVGAGTANADPSLYGPECNGTPVAPGSYGQLNVQGFQVFMHLPIRIMADKDVIGQTNANGPVTVIWPARWVANDGLIAHIVIASQPGETVFPGCFVTLAPPRPPTT